MSQNISSQAINFATGLAVMSLGAFAAFYTSGFGTLAIGLRLSLVILGLTATGAFFAIKGYLFARSKVKLLLLAPATLAALWAVSGYLAVQYALHASFVQGDRPTVELEAALSRLPQPQQQLAREYFQRPNKNPYTRGDKVTVIAAIKKEMQFRQRTAEAEENEKLLRPLNEARARQLNEKMERARKEEADALEQRRIPMREAVTVHVASWEVSSLDELRAKKHKVDLPLKSIRGATDHYGVTDLLVLQLEYRNFSTRSISYLSGRVRVTTGSGEQFSPTSPSCSINVLKPFEHKSTLRRECKININGVKPPIADVKIKWEPDSIEFGNDNA